MDRRVANAFPAPPPPPKAPYYHHPPHHHVAAVGFHQYPQNDNRDQRFNQPHSDNMTVDAPPSNPNSTNASIAKLYVAPVPWTAKEDHVRQVFEKYGNVTEIILPKDKFSGERAAYCFVKYKRLEEGNAAIAALTDQFTFPGEMSPIKVRYADAERERVGVSTVQIPDKLYVRCLNKQTTKMDVYEVFCRFGVIEDIYMAVDDMKVSRGFAFVQFSCREMALAAIKGLNGVFTMRGSDQPLTVRFADPKKPRLGEPSVFRSNFNDPYWHPQPYPQWGSKEPAAPRVVDFASQPNHFPQQNAQAVSEVQKPLHQDVEKHQKYETASVETKGDGPKISNAIREDDNTVNPECDWSEHTCPDGNKYYYHCVTCESTWEKPEEYSMFERWFDKKIRLQDQKVASPSNNQSQDAIENTEQVQSHRLQQTTKLQQESLSTAVRYHFLK